MKAIDIQTKTALLEKAIEVLDLLKYCKRRIEITRENAQLIPWRQAAYNDRLVILKMCLVRIEQRYAKIISQL